MRKNLTRKSLGRYVAVQAIYNLLCLKSSKDEILSHFLSERDFKLELDFGFYIKNRNFDKIFFTNIINAYDVKSDFIEKLIVENLDKKWTLMRMPVVLSAILKVAVSEMIISPKTSIGVLATEYIFLTESFFSKKESSFVNAILQKIYLILKNE